MLAELTTPVSASTPVKEILEIYNRFAAMVEAPVVKRFENRTVALRRLGEIQEVARARFVVAPTRKKRQKVFNYPPAPQLKTLKPGSLRAQARDLLINGATLGRVEQLVADWDRANGDEPHRLEPRAYGLVRLLHSYIGYALREEKTENGETIIYLMTPEQWKAWKNKAA
jgi:hypothetical protein